YYGASYIWQIDVTAPEAPFLKGQTLSGASKLALGTTRLFGVNGDALRMYDISDPESASAAGFVVGAGDVGYDRNATVAFTELEWE
ncbi:MAG: hypothetical protein IE927_15850, partial [Rhodobacterales bacterium]|nr:hypothetical protein [Rhodobacterales bacterium]